MVLITGVPGIGKTQLTEEFVRQVEKKSSAKCLYVGVDTLRSPLHMFRAIAEKLGVRGVRRSVLKEFEKSAGIKRQIVGVQAGAATVRGGVTVSDAVDKSPPPFEAMLASVSGHATWTDVGALGRSGRRSGKALAPMRWRTSRCSTPDGTAAPYSRWRQDFNTLPKWWPRTGCRDTRLWRWACCRMKRPATP